MIFNLTDNAINYNKPQGSVTLTTGTENGRPFVRVEDTGIGIAPADQQRVFERFYRVDKSHSKMTGGTGLGLSIVKHGAALHHAEVELKSALGEGLALLCGFLKNDDWVLTLSWGSKRIDTKVSILLGLQFSLYFLTRRKSESGDRFEKIRVRQRIFSSVSFSTDSQCRIPYCYTYG